MKYRLRYLLASILTVGSLVATPVTVLAHEGDVQSESTTNTSTSDSTATTEAKKKEMTDRINKFKEQFKIKQTEAQKTVLKAKCTSAQGVVKKHHEKFGNSVTKRTNAYKNLHDRLDKLVTKLKEKGVDTTTLEQQVTVLNTMLDNYNTDLTAYKQTLSDLKDVDCKTDPDAFKAALEAARAAHSKLVTDVTEIRAYLKDTIKSTLQAIKDSLENTESNSGDDPQQNATINTQQEPTTSTNAAN